MNKSVTQPVAEGFPAVGKTLVKVCGLACLVGLYAAIPATCMHFGILKSLAEMPAEIPAALTVVLGWLLVFRTNTSYSRWWEARTLWGSLTNTIRNLAIKFATLAPMSDHERRQVRSALARFPVVLKDHLRGSTTQDDLDALPESVTSATHRPTALTETLYRKLQNWKDAGALDSTTLLIVDEDVPGGASAYLLDAILHGAGAYRHLDSAPVTLTARPHLPPYGSDGDYFSKPSHDDIVEAAYALMSEADPARFPELGTARPAVR